METAIRRPVRTTKPEARIFLQPVAAPSVLGYFALGSGLIIWGSWFAAGWGTEQDPSSFFPFLLLFAGVGQLGAALWAYRARAGVAAALHGSWAAFFMGVGLIYLLVTTHTIVAPARGDAWQSLGQWLIYMSVISLTTAVAALARSPVGFVAQAVLAAGSAFAAAGLLLPSASLQEVGGWLFVAAAVFGFYAGAALMLDSVYGIAVLPLLRRGKAEPVEYVRGDPGVKVGQ